MRTKTNGHWLEGGGGSCNRGETKTTGGTAARFKSNQRKQNKKLWQDLVPLDICINLNAEVSSGVHKEICFLLVSHPNGSEANPPYIYMLRHHHHPCITSSHGDRDEGRVTQRRLTNAPSDGGHYGR